MIINTPAAVVEIEYGNRVLYSIFRTCVIRIKILPIISMTPNKAGPLPASLRVRDRSVIANFSMRVKNPAIPNFLKNPFHKYAQT